MDDKREELNMFISSIRQGDELSVLEQLKKFLRPLLATGIINNVYSFQEIAPGSNIDKEIDRMINRSKIFIMLISIDYLNEYGDESERIIERIGGEEAFFYPLLVSHCPWSDFFDKLEFHVRPENGHSIMSLSNEDRSSFFNGVYDQIKDDILIFQRAKEQELELKRSKEYWIQLYRNIERMASQYVESVKIPSFFFYEISERITELEKIDNVTDMSKLATELVADCSAKTTYLLSLASGSLSKIKELKNVTNGIKSDEKNINKETLKLVRRFEEKVISETSIGLDRYSQEFEKGVIDRVYKKIRNKEIKGFNKQTQIDELLEEVKAILSKSSRKYSAYVEKELIEKINNDFAALIEFIGDLYSRSNFHELDLHIKKREDQLLDSIQFYSVEGKIQPMLNVVTSISPIGSIVGALLGSGVLSMFFFDEDKFKQELFESVREEIRYAMRDFESKTTKELAYVIKRTTRQILKESHHLTQEYRESMEYKIESEIELINEARLTEFVKSVSLLREYYK